MRTLRTFSGNCYSAFLETLSACGVDIADAASEWDALMDKTTPKQNIQIAFGALSPPLYAQLQGQHFIVFEEDVHFEQRLAEAMVLCNLHGILTEAEYQKAQKRLFKRILGRLREIIQCED